MPKKAVKKVAKSVRVRKTPGRSFACPEALWRGVTAYARRNHIAPSAAVRMLITTGLAAQDLAATFAWQIAASAMEADAIEAGDRSEVSREEVFGVLEEGRRQLAAAAKHAG